MLGERVRTELVGNSASRSPFVCGSDRSRLYHSLAGLETDLPLPTPGRKKERHLLMSTQERFMYLRKQRKESQTKNDNLKVSHSIHTSIGEPASAVCDTLGSHAQVTISTNGYTQGGDCIGNKPLTQESGLYNRRSAAKPLGP